MKLALFNQLIGIPTAFAQQAAENSVAAQTGDSIQNLAADFIRAVPLWITGGIVIILSFVVAKIVKSSVENRMSEEGLEEEHREIQIVASRGAAAGVLILGITIGLKIAGIDLTAILAAGAFGIGFAMKDIIMNFLAGIIVLLQKQFTIGDTIKVGGTMGVIQQIQSRYSVIKTFEGLKVIIPNADLFKKEVTSYTSNPFRRFEFNLSVDLYYDLKEVIDLIYDSIKKVPGILASPKPSIIVCEPGGFANILKIRCWVDAKKGVLKPKSSLIRQIHKDFYRKGWSWPYPTQNLVFDKDVQPDVAKRAKEYVERHKKVEPAPAIMQNEQKDMPQASIAAQPLPTPTQEETETSIVAQEKTVPDAKEDTQVPVWLQEQANKIETPQMPLAPPEQKETQPQEQQTVQQPI
jgi:small conductance mechanosensitive channel